MLVIWILLALALATPARAQLTVDPRVPPSVTNSRPPDQHDAEKGEILVIGALGYCLVLGGAAWLGYRRGRGPRMTRRPPNQTIAKHRGPEC